MSDGFSILERLVLQSNVRNGVLASNIANVDTPNYKARDVKFGEVLGAEMGLASTDPKHLSGSSSGATAELRVEETQPWSDGNNVELDQEVAKMTENAMFFQAGITLLSKKVQMFKNALRTSG
ncbi:MAG: flagellar basal body rod protein FlgB [Nitrospirae bacterium]|nr:flagellar basal body rod protein FlgB [Nitrospirota bacterium]NTW65143.1 flagellar basal body rod protein FlgB [Nitrospirota bacterium]